MHTLGGPGTEQDTPAMDGDPSTIQDRGDGPSRSDQPLMGTTERCVDVEFVELGSQPKCSLVPRIQPLVAIQKKIIYWS